MHHAHLSRWLARARGFTTYKTRSAGIRVLKAQFFFILLVRRQLHNHVSPLFVIGLWSQSDVRTCSTIHTRTRSYRRHTFERASTIRSTLRHGQARITGIGRFVTRRSRDGSQISAMYCDERRAWGRSYDLHHDYMGRRISGATSGRISTL